MASKSTHKPVAAEEPQELEALEASFSGDELVPGSNQEPNVSKRFFGKTGVVLTVVGLVGVAVMITLAYRTPYTSVSSGFTGLNELASMKVGMPEGADRSPDMSSSLNPPKLCDEAVVKRVCSELKSDTTKPAVDKLGVMEIAEALGLDEVPAVTFLGSLGLVGLHSHVTVNCQELCESLVASIAEYRRPTGHDVGGRLALGKVVWDIDLSPEALASIVIPDKPADPEGSKADPDIQDLPLQGRLLTETETSAIAADAPDILAGLFRIFPRPATEDLVPKMGAPPPAAAPAPGADPCAPAQPPAAAPAPDGDPCAPATPGAPATPCAPTTARRLKQGNEEAIYGNGKDYAGSQSMTRKRKRCLAWSSWPRYRGTSNHCRNPDGSETIWCFTSQSGAWGLCDPVGAPLMFAETVEKATVVAKAWLTKTLREFSGEKLPGAYEKWMGPSQTVAKKGLTKSGCACKKVWTHSGQTFNDYCGNPDQDAGGEWCMVQSRSCQSSTWGYCFPTSSNSKPCGPGCQGVHKKLLATAALLNQLTFKYDAANVGAYAYIMTWGNKLKQRIPVKKIESIQKSYKGYGKVLLETGSGSDEIKGRKVIYMCPVWYNLCKGNLDNCGRTNYGTTVGTVIHETMHHVPVSLKDYLYYRGTTSAWVAANKGNHAATKVVKNAADPMEYFVADNNGYKDTGR